MYCSYDNEGRIRPSFIEAARSLTAWQKDLTTRVEFDPPSLRPVPDLRVQSGVVATRVEFDPPSLRRGERVGYFYGVITNEGRIRPSFIEARAFGLRGIFGGGNEGRIRPSFIEASLLIMSLLTTLSTRVEFDPPSLRLCR